MPDLSKILADSYEVAAKAFDEILLTDRQIVLKKAFDSANNTPTYKVSPLYPNNTLKFIIDQTIKNLPDNVSPQEGLNKIIEDYITMRHQQLISKTYPSGQVLTKGVIVQDFGTTIFIRSVKPH